MIARMSHRFDVDDLPLFFISHSAALELTQPMSQMIPIGELIPTGEISAINYPNNNKMGHCKESKTVVGYSFVQSGVASSLKEERHSPITVGQGRTTTGRSESEAVEGFRKR